MKELVQSWLIILALFGAFVLGAALFNMDLTEEHTTLEGAYNYVSSENAKLQEQINTMNVTIKYFEEQIVKCDLTIENSKLDLLAVFNEQGYLNREDLN